MYLVGRRHEGVIVRWWYNSVVKPRTSMHTAQCAQRWYYCCVCYHFKFQIDFQLQPKPKHKTPTLNGWCTISSIIHNIFRVNYNCNSFGFEFEFGFEYLIFNRTIHCRRSNNKLTWCQNPKHREKEWCTKRDIINSNWPIPVHYSTFSNYHRIKWIDTWAKSTRISLFFAFSSQLIALESAICYFLNYFYCIAAHFNVKLPLVGLLYHYFFLHFCHCFALDISICCLRFI